MPDIPTTDEAGLPGFYFLFRHAMWAPKGTPKEIIAKLNKAAVAGLADPEIHQRMIDLAQEIYPPEKQTPEALLAFHQAEIAKWWPIIESGRSEGGISFSLEHDPVGKPVPSFPDHALLLRIWRWVLVFFGVLCRLVMADGTAGRGAQDPVMSRHVAGDPADDRAFDAALRGGRRNRCRKANRHRGRQYRHRPNLAKNLFHYSLINLHRISPMCRGVIFSVLTSAAGTFVFVAMGLLDGFGFNILCPTDIPAVVCFFVSCSSEWKEHQSQHQWR